jgi:hypothetical protein
LKGWRDKDEDIPSYKKSRTASSRPASAGRSFLAREKSGKKKPRIKNPPMPHRPVVKRKEKSDPNDVDALVGRIMKVAARGQVCLGCGRRPLGIMRNARLHGDALDAPTTLEDREIGPISFFGGRHPRPYQAGGILGATQAVGE